ncbi:MAG: hypothetical protein KF782_13355 [Labilithrix sp.]|nr:hypothetical protein [Labilithrix sp.]
MRSAPTTSEGPERTSRHRTGMRPGRSFVIDVLVNGERFELGAFRVRA